jgi:phosphonate transport system substrate-binding protein
VEKELAFIMTSIKHKAHYLVWILFLLAFHDLAAAKEQEFIFSVVPQQSASKTVKIWDPIVRYLSERSGYSLRLRVYKNIPVFEESLRNEESDFSYMNPYHYTVFHEGHGYQALSKAKNKRIKGILVVKKDGPVNSAKDLNNTKVAFPSPAAFAASLLVRGWLKQQGISFTPVYVRSHDSGYLNVTQRRFPASGGVLRTFNNMSETVRNQLHILYTTDGFTPHAIASHPRVPAAVVEAVQKALLSMDSDETGRALLQSVKIEGWEKGINADWDDVRALNLTALE